MSPSRPIFCATHPRACSTAFERVFMTRTDLNCIHEPAGDAFYFGPERMSSRYENDEKARKNSGFSGATYKKIFDRIESEGEEGKRLFIKDIIHYLFPPNNNSASIAPSLAGKSIKKCAETQTKTNSVNGITNGNTNGATSGHANGHANGVTNGHILSTPYPYNTVPESNNPTVVPFEILRKFHWTILIRNPRFSIPSYWRCTIPPLNDITGFYTFMPSEAGYQELRRFFDFLIQEKLIGPTIAGEHGKLADGEVRITVVDADDLLDDPKGIISAYCREVGIEYDPSMLIWDTDEQHERAKAAFEKWRGFHDDAICSKSLKPRSSEHKKEKKSVEIENREWAEKYGEESAQKIRACVDKNMADYLYLKSFALKI